MEDDEDYNLSDFFESDHDINEDFGLWSHWLEWNNFWVLALLSACNCIHLFLMLVCLLFIFTIWYLEGKVHLCSYLGLLEINFLLSSPFHSNVGLNSLQWPPLVEVVDTWELPPVLIERYNAAGGEGTALCGIFPEIRRAWASVDNSLFLWRFDKWWVFLGFWWKIHNLIFFWGPIPWIW